jgi:flagellin-like protein
MGMKANRKFIGGEEAVSAVIGVILMVAITVAIAATVYVYVSGMIGGTTSTTPTIAMNIFSRDDGQDQITWHVTQVEGEPVSDDAYSWNLLYANNGTNVTGATLTFSDNNGDGYINSGDTFLVDAGRDGTFVLTITDSATGKLLFKSAKTKY